MREAATQDIMRAQYELDDMFPVASSATPTCLSFPRNYIR